MFRRKDFFRDQTEAIETFAQARADGFWIQSQLGCDFAVTQVAIITQLNDFPAGVVQLIEALPNETRSFGVYEQGIRPGTLRWRIEAFARAIEREMNYPAPALLGTTLSAKIHRLVRGHAQQPRMKRSLLILAAGLLSIVSNARGDGFIVVERPFLVRPGHFPFAPLEVASHHVEVKIDGQVAVTSIDQEFYNPNDQRLEGTYMFPVPKDAHIDKFSMEIGGKMVDAELLPADKARQIYEDIVRKIRDPALLEYGGRDLFKVSIFPIEPRSRKPIKISYTELLRSDTGTVTYSYPLSTEKFSAQPIKSLSVKVEVKTEQPLASIYSPSHKVEIKRDGPNRAV